MRCTKCTHDIQAFYYESLGCILKSASLQSQLSYGSCGSVENGSQSIGREGERENGIVQWNWFWVENQKKKQTQTDRSDSIANHIQMVEQQSKLHRNSQQDEFKFVFDFVALCANSENISPVECE